jgi:uncharacterized protein (DUF2141 family)
LVSGYRILYGTDPLNLEGRLDVGATTVGSVNGLQEGQSYWFSVCSYNNAGFESIPSEPINYVVPLPPTVALVSSLNGTVLDAFSSMPLTAEVVPNGHAILRVSFFDGTTLIGESFSAPFTLVWSPTASGLHLISARLFFDDGSSVESSPAEVLVKNPPPVIALNALSPTTLVAPASIVLGAEVTANGHTISKVQFFSGSSVIGEDNSAPYNFTWSNVAAGTYAVRARLVYDGGSVMDTAAASVAVENPPPVIALNALSPTTLVAPASIVLGAEVTANGHTISKVQFFSGSNLVGEDSSAPYNVTWSNVAAGTYAVKARLVYDGGTVMDTAAAAVTVQELLPVVALTSPTAGATYTPPGQFTITAAVTPNGQSISKVQFFANGLLIGERSSAPYSINWSSVVSGTWALEAKAAYGDSKSVTSTPVTVIVGTVAAPWSTRDIGTTGLAGGAGVDGGKLFVDGAGVINNSKDAFRFLYQPMTGDGEMTVRIDSMKNTGGGGSIGVMIRESLSVDSRHAFIGVSGAGAFRWEKRSQTGGTTAVNNYSKSTPPNTWIRLVRVGNTLSGYTSTDGIKWTRANYASITMTANVYVGVAVASGSTTTLNNVAFSAPVVVP